MPAKKEFSTAEEAAEYIEFLRRRNRGKPAPLNVSWISKAAAQQWSVQLSSQAASRNRTRTTLLIQEGNHSPWLPP